MNSIRPRNHDKQIRKSLIGKILPDTRSLLSFLKEIVKEKKGEETILREDDDLLFKTLLRTVLISRSFFSKLSYQSNKNLEAELKRKYEAGQLSFDPEAFKTSNKNLNGDRRISDQKIDGKRRNSVQNSRRIKWPVIDLPQKISLEVNRDREQSVLNLVIESLVASSFDRCSHLLTFGYQKSSDKYQNYDGMDSMSGTYNYIPNTNVNFLEKSIWSRLWERIGDQLTRFILRDCFLFAPCSLLEELKDEKKRKESFAGDLLTRQGYIQVSGVALYNVVKFQSSWKREIFGDPGGKVDRTKRKREETIDLTDKRRKTSLGKSFQISKEISSNNPIELNGKNKRIHHSKWKREQLKKKQLQNESKMEISTENNITEPSKTAEKNGSKEKKLNGKKEEGGKKEREKKEEEKRDEYETLSKIKIQRNWQFYGNVYTKSERPEDCQLSGLGSDDRGAKKLIDRVLMRDPVDLYGRLDKFNEESEEKEIKLSRRMKTMIPLFVSLIKRFKKCKFRILLNHYCPIKPKNDQKKSIERMEEEDSEMNSEEEWQPSTQAFSPISNTPNSIDELMENVSEEDETEKEIVGERKVKEKKVEENGLRDSSHKQVIQFLRSVVKQVIPNEFWGSGENYREIMKKIALFVSLRRFENFTLEQAVEGFQISHCLWVKPNGKPTKVTLEESRIQKSLVYRFIYWFFTFFIIPVIKTFFYCTEHGAFKNKIFFYRRGVWANIRKKVLEDFKSSIFNKLDKKEALSILSKRTFSFSYIRILPKKTGARPILNFRRKPSEKEYKMLASSNKRFINPLCINIILQNVFLVIKHEKNCGNPWGGSVFGFNDVYKKVCPFIKLLRFNRVTSIYLASVDMTRSFDSIQQNKLFQILEEKILPKEKEDYLIVKHASIKLKPGTQDEVTTFYHKSVKDPTDYPQFWEVAPLISKKGREEILIDQVVYPIETRITLLGLLRELIFNNMIKDGEGYFKQVVGIAQGSVVSPLLCSLFYGDLENRHFYNGSLSLDYPAEPPPSPFFSPMKMVYSAPRIGSPKKEEVSSSSSSSGTTGSPFKSPRTPAPSCGILMRFVDDSIYVTTSIADARKFVKDYETGFEEYGAFANKEKTKANFCVDAGRPPTQGIIQTKDGRSFIPWYGFLVNTQNFEFQIHYDSFKDEGVLNSLTVARCHNPGDVIWKKLIRSMRCRIHPLVLDSNINSIFTIYLNVYQMFRFLAVKFVCYARGLPQGPQKNPQFFSQMILNLLDHIYGNIKQSTHTEIAIRMG
eukprot:TRINITY_DN6237_c0_g2_i2.p1 TRINITY_DN6237_c0_g2~~TRINITY_DN6237_c0_g2_i2.p1  ORF type:complete len:1261 (+),score=472.14 TRINITY_DN6237_c0_g2_i2:58-3840(+)